MSEQNMDAPSGTGSRASHEAADASSPQASIPSAWDAGRVFSILAETCGQFRKGAVYQGSPHLVAQMERGLEEGESLKGGGVLEIYDMPPASDIPEGCEVVDLHFVKVAVNKEKAEARRRELVALLSHFPDPEILAGGPSYIHMGGYLGDQGLALELFALGKVLGLWEVITPATFGATGAQADQMAGAGYVMCTGFRAASVGETQRAETPESGSVEDEHAAPKADAQPIDPEPLPPRNHQ